MVMGCMSSSRSARKRGGVAHLLSQEQVQLGCVFLHVAHGVQQQLPKGQLAPGEAAQSVGLLAGQDVSGLLAPAALALQRLLRTVEDYWF
jgi:hypothetical protein